MRPYSQDLREKIVGALEAQEETQEEIADRFGGVSAPMTVNGAVDGEVFLTSVREVLCPTLSKGDVVVMDNLGAHKVAGVREAIEAKGARVEYLPPYSPDFNPIEKCWSKIKTALRKAKARGVGNCPHASVASGDGSRCAGLVYSLWLSGTLIGNPL